MSKYPFTSPQILLYDNDGNILATVDCKIKGGSIVSKKKGSKVFSVGTAVRAVLSVLMKETGNRVKHEVSLDVGHNICWHGSKISVRAQIENP